MKVVPVAATALTLIAGALGSAALLAVEVAAARRRQYAEPRFDLGLRATVGRDNAPPFVSSYSVIRRRWVSGSTG